MKRICLFLLLLCLCLSAAACGDETATTESTPDSTSVESTPVSTEESIPADDTSSDAPAVSEDVSDGECGTDMIPPAFVDAVDGVLPPLAHNQGEEIDLLAGIEIMDDNGDFTPTLEITDDGGYDPDVPGTYTVTFTATDGFCNSATATMQVTVKAVVQTEKITLSGLTVEVDRADALAYTSSGTAFRAKDALQVMDKDVFVSQYNQYSAEHTNNGSVPYFPNGVIVILDKENQIVQVRIAAGDTFQIDADGSVKTSGFAWTNAIDEANGGGMFKGILTDLETLIPEGGTLLFTANPGEQQTRIALLRGLFFSGYESGAITADQQDVYPAGAELEWN